jgi:hypothetical protein
MRTVIALISGALAVCAFPALGVASHGASHGKGPVYGTPGDPTPGPKAGLPAKAKAYGRYCQGKSKKHVKGEKGTEFSRCVTAMAKAANNGPDTNGDGEGDRVPPAKACKGLSKKHVKGEKGTEFSRCVVAAAKLQRDQNDDDLS